MMDLMRLLALAVACCNVVFCVVELKGTHEVYSSANTKYVYQRASTAKPSAVLFLAHGCHHSANDWWPKSESCSSCVGLPVEKSIVQEALKRNYFVFASSSSNRDHKCWTNHDIEATIHLINYVYSTYLDSDVKIPFHLLGGSSGGSFVGLLASSQLTTPHVSSICIQIMSPQNFSLLPPSLFVLMTKDAHTLHHVKVKLSHHTNSHHKLLHVDEKPITAGFFNDHSNALTVHDSSTLHAAYIAEGIVSPTTHLLLLDPRNPVSKWREVATKALPHIIPAVDTLEADKSAVSELMNVAWATHEITDEHNKEIFNWFDTYKRPHVPRQQ